MIFHTLPPLLVPAWQGSQSAMYIILVAVEGGRQGQAERPRGARTDGGTPLRREGLQGAIHI